jgi:hypothetical protein
VLLSVFLVFQQNSTAFLEININELKSGNNPSGKSSNSQTKNPNMAQVPTPEPQPTIMANNLTDKKPVGFLGLPYEIRLVIYRYECPGQKFCLFSTCSL